MGPYAGVDYNITLCRFQSRLQHIYRGQPYARVDFIPPVKDFGFGLWLRACVGILYQGLERVKNLRF
jgi:hypothetical protein